jgi:hypothetical protein
MGTCSASVWRLVTGLDRWDLRFEFFFHFFLFISKDFSYKYFLFHNFILISYFFRNFL